mgnify:CR=1 FL=1
MLKALKELGKRSDIYQQLVEFFNIYPEIKKKLTEESGRTVFPPRKKLFTIISKGTQPIEVAMHHNNELNKRGDTTGFKLLASSSAFSNGELLITSIVEVDFIPALHKRTLQENNFHNQNKRNGQYETFH